MRLWHQSIIPLLPLRQLTGQHRECCALRGNGWGRKHATVDYVFTHPRSWLFAYHQIVMSEMSRRGYVIDKRWMDPCYRGKRLGFDNTETLQVNMPSTSLIYPEHNESYLMECRENLRGKGIEIGVSNPTLKQLGLK